MQQFRHCSHLKTTGGKSTKLCVLLLSGNQNCMVEQKPLVLNSSGSNSKITTDEAFQLLIWSLEASTTVVVAGTTLSGPSMAGFITVINSTLQKMVKRKRATAEFARKDSEISGISSVI